MKVGLSYSHCMVDIIEGRVRIDDVLVIISRTDFDVTVDRQWEDIWLGYTFDPKLATWANLIDREQEVRSMTERLLSEGKLHQPRKFGGRGHLAYGNNYKNIHWLETVMIDSDMEKNSTIKQAWNHYQLVIGLSGFASCPAVSN